MKAMQQLICIFLGIVISTSVFRAQCNINQINTTMAAAGFQLLNVDPVAFPCALYYYNPNTTNNWNTAQSQAAAVGATLLTVCSLAENDAVWQAAVAAGITGGLWLGYSDQVTEGNWVWADGSTCSFTNWNTSEPSNSSCFGSTAGEDGAVIQMSNGRWNDVYLSPLGFCLTPASYASLVKVNLCPQTVPSPSTSTLCQGASVSLSSTTTLGSSPYTYAWFGPSSNQLGTGSPFSYSPTSSTTVTLVATDQYGCTDTETITLTVNSAPTMTSATSATICSGETLNIPLSASPAGATFSWQASSNPSVTGQSLTAQSSSLINNTLINTTSSPQTVTYSVTPSIGGCSGPVQTVTVTVNPTPSPAIVGVVTQPSCVLSTGSVSLSGLPSSGSWTITASPGGLTSTGTGTSTTFSGLTASTTYTFIVTSGSCTSSASTNVVFNSVPGAPGAPVLGAIIQPTCSLPTGSVSLSGLPSSGSWTVTATPGGATITGSGSTAIFNGLPENNSYTFIVSDGTCSSPTSLSAQINAVTGIPATPVISVLAPTCVSPGIATITNYDGTLTYTFSPSGPTVGAGGLISAMIPGQSYTLTVSSGACVSTASPVFTVVDQLITPVTPLITVNAPTCISSGSSIISNYDPSVSYTFSPIGPSAGVGVVVSSMTPGTSYTVVATSGACSSAASLPFTYGSQLIVPNVMVTPDTSTINLGELVTLTASGADSYTWSPVNGLNSATGPTVEAQPLGTTEYCVVGTNNDGCSDTSCAIVNVLINCDDLFIPNAFSPNENTLDDKFCLFGASCIETMTLRVFNRWGELIYLSNDSESCWDGSFKGEFVNSGAYAYVLEAVLATGERIERKGSVQVIR